jgi:hypothetical protein
MECKKGAVRMISKQYYSDFKLDWKNQKQKYFFVRPCLHTLLHSLLNNIRDTITIKVICSPSSKLTTKLHVGLPYQTSSLLDYFKHFIVSELLFELVLQTKTTTIVFHKISMGRPRPPCEDIHRVNLP